MPPPKKKPNGKGDAGKPNGHGALKDSMREIFNENFTSAFDKAIAPHMRDLRKEIRQEVDKGRKATVADVRAMLVPALAKLGRELREIRAAQKSRS